MKRLIAVLAVIIAAGAGCVTSHLSRQLSPPPPVTAPDNRPQVREVVRRQGPGLITLDINAADYNEIADRLVESLSAEGRVRKDGVVALGPVQVSLDGDYRFDAERLQEKIQVIALRSGRFQCSYAVNAIQGNSAAEERYRIVKLRWEQENAIDAEDLQTFGKLAKVDYMLFGRLSSVTARGEEREEVTYTFNWKLGDCLSGLLIWADEAEITKMRQ